MKILKQNQNQQKYHKEKKNQHHKKQVDYLKEQDQKRNQ
jgi:hypothetical protein